MIEQVVDKMKTRLDDACQRGSISGSERVLSIVAGSFIFGYSAKRLFRKPLTALSGLTLGGALLMRGITGKCPAKGVIEPTEDKEQNLTLIERRYFEK